MEAATSKDQQSNRNERALDLPFFEKFGGNAEVDAVKETRIYPRLNHLQI